MNQIAGTGNLQATHNCVFGVRGPIVDNGNWKAGARFCARFCLFVVKLKNKIADLDQVLVEELLFPFDDLAVDERAIATV